MGRSTTRDLALPVCTGLVIAVVAVILGVVRDVEWNTWAVLLVVLAGALPAVRVHGALRARRAGVRMREDLRG